MGVYHPRCDTACQIATGLDFQSKCGNSRGDDRQSFPVVNLSTEPYGDTFDWVDIVPYILHGRVHDCAQGEFIGCVTEK
jgi:hypothetical protein